MALWRNRDLEDIIGGKLEPGVVTEEGLRKLVGDIPAEHEFVDYKSFLDFDKCGQNPNWNAKQERAKDVCAAANGRGAILIYGVEDALKAGVPDRLVPFPDTKDRYKLIEQFRKDVRQQAMPTPLFDMFAVDAAAGGFYLVVVVPPSSSAPHAVTVQPGHNRESLYYFVRAPGETHIRPLKEHEVADRYSVRHRRQEDRARHAAAVWSEGQDELTAYSGAKVWLAVAVVPDVPVEALMTPRVRDEITAWDDQQNFPDSILELRGRALDSPFPAPGKMVYTAVFKERQTGTRLPKAVGSYRELHADGSAYAALMLKDGGEGGQAIVLESDDLIDAIASLIMHTLDWTTERAGRWGNATVQIGFVVGENSRGSSPMVQLAESGGESVHGLRRTRAGKISTTLADLASLHTMQDKLRVAYFAALPIVQGFGVTEPAWITEEGALRWRYMTNRSEPPRWAVEHQVELDKSLLP